MEKAVPKRGREQQEEDNPAPPLVGRIVEKGFDTEKKNKLPLTSSVPRPSVIAFPVARHRSHGPHWAPISRNVQMDDKDQEEDVDKDDTDFNPISSFANPIKRKQKKSLDFSKWKDIVSEDSSVIPTKMAVENQLGRVTVDNEEKEMQMEVEEVHKELQCSTVMHQTDDKDYTCIDDSMNDLNFKHENRQPLGFNIGNSEDEQGSMSLESQIDAENRAQLQHMSAEEIAEAQSEIMEKMKPGLIEILKKRGRNKLVSKAKMVSSDVDNDNQLELKTKTVTSGVEDGNHLGVQHNENQINQDAESDPPLGKPKTVPVSALKPSNYTNDAPNTNEEKTLGATNNKWNAWSERVEAARIIRFALDGTVLENNPTQKPEDGNTFNSGQSSVDRVAERDFLRTEGDPGGAGYTIKEAVALSRSMVPGQRALALQLLASVLDKALCGIQQGQVGWNVNKADIDEKSVDWEAVWAYTLGPDPELALSLRIALDDNHISVVSTTVKVLHSTLSCDMNEGLYDLLEKMATYENVMCTAPIFQSRPGIEGGFLQGGFWKYNTKPSNIIPSGDETATSEDEGNRTIQDDVIVAGQDFAAGLIRMGILPRIHHLLVTGTSAALEEHLISILIGLARHSPTCANAIFKFPELIQTIVDSFKMKNTLEVNLSKIKATMLIKVLAQSDKNVCIHFKEKGMIQDMMWHFYRPPLSFEQWIKSGKENCRLMSALTIEQLRLWKVCIQYGHCISYFADFFPVLCFWLTPPSFDTLTKNNVLGIFASITREAYLVLAALARRLPILHSVEQLSGKIPVSKYNTEMWSWSHVSPMVESALKWISLKSNPFLSEIINAHGRTAYDAQESSLTSIVWVISAVVKMLSSIVKKIVPGSDNSFHISVDRVPWLPEFVPKIGLEIVKNRFFDFLVTDTMVPSGGESVAKGLISLRLHSDYELSLSSVCCLHGIVQLVVYLDKSIQLAKQEHYTPPSGEQSLSREGKILENGIFMWSQGEVRSMLVTFMTLLSSGWHQMHNIETFGRGGPAPGVGLGWGVSGGGFWSMTVLLEQTESLFLMEIFEMFQVSLKDLTFTLQRVNCALRACLIAGPRDTIVIQKALDFLLQAPVLKHLDVSIRHFVQNRGIKSIGWEYEEEDYLCHSQILKNHLRNRWLCAKKKSTSSDSDQKILNKGSNPLGTIYEEESETTNDDTLCEPECTSMVIEWAHQRLPLPTHWFLSPISTIHSKAALDGDLEVAKSGLFLLLALEAMSSSSPVHDVPLIWKLHSLSVVLLVGMDVLHDEKSRDLYRTLQEFYGQLLNESRCSQEFLKFKSDVHESYTTFIDTFIEQFGATSYGDVLYGRQVSLYLHSAVEAPVRLAAWNALSNAHILELLPPIGECFDQAEGYLHTEIDEALLEAYTKSWVSGGLDKAALRGSMTYTLALHHLSSFIFNNTTDDKKLPLRNKLVKSLVRDYSRKPKHEGMLMELIKYNKEGKSEIETRLVVLAKACEGNSSLVNEIEKLKSSPKIFAS